MNIEQKLQELRKLWKAFPDQRKTIELQAKVLNMAREERDKEAKRVLEYLA